MQDPFAPTQEEAQTDSGTIIYASPGPTPEPSGGDHVVTLKGGAGYEAPWYVIHAPSLDEVERLFDQEADRLARVFGRIQAAAAHFRGLAPTSAGTTERSSTAAPRGATEPPSWFPPPPAPGWVYKTGFKNGNTWHAWAPPNKGGGDWQFYRAP